MAELSTEERFAKLEQIVATQSEMLLKLVEMMNHLGQQAITNNERIEAVSHKHAEQIEAMGNMFKSLITKLTGMPDPDSN